MVSMNIFWGHHEFLPLSRRCPSSKRICLVSSLMSEKSVFPMLLNWNVKSLFLLCPAVCWPLVEFWGPTTPFSSSLSPPTESSDWLLSFSEGSSWSWLDSSSCSSVSISPEGGRTRFLSTLLTVNKQKPRGTNKVKVYRYLIVTCPCVWMRVFVHSLGDPSSSSPLVALPLTVCCFVGCVSSQSSSSSSTEDLTNRLQTKKNIFSHFLT